jgi:hypothetical protein
MVFFKECLFKSGNKFLKLRVWLSGEAVSGSADAALLLLESC